MDFKIITKNNYTVDITEKTEGDATICRFLFSFDKKISPEEISIEWEDCERHYYSVYTPCFLSPTHLRPDWMPVSVKSGICTNMPFYALLGKSGDCLMTLALDDVISPTELSFGYREETNGVSGKVKLFTSPCAPIKSFAVSLRIEKNCGDLSEACKRVVDWWGKAGYANDYIPDAAFEPVYSTWYNFHQNLRDDKLLEECRIAVKLGVKTLIIDDGWQTDDISRGYGYCGDWAVAASKFTDFKAFVKSVHELGMKALVWFPVPYMGEYAEAYERFSDKLLYRDDPMHVGILDPRYKEVRDYLVNTYTDFMRAYDLDGLKLDFIDSFKTDRPFFHQHGMDCYSVEDGVLRFLSEMRKAVSSVKSDALIEFRQTYCGPVIGTYANILRVADCPGDTATNLNESVRLRLLSDRVAVHSDMMTCNACSSSEAIADQLIAALFCVPQLSFMLSDLSDAQMKVLKFFLDFQRRHSARLIKNRPTVYRTDKGIVKLESACADEKIVALYAESAVTADGENAVYIVNGSGQNGIAVRSSADYEYSEYNCCGELVKSGIIARGFQYMETDKCSVIELRKAK